MAITVTHRGTRSNSTANSSWAFSPTSDFSSGSFGVILFGWRTVASSAITSFTDSIGNTWTSRTSATNGEYRLELFTCDSISSLATTDTVTVNFSSNTTSRGCFLYEVTGSGSITYDDANSTTFASSGTITTSTTVENGNVVFGFDTRASTIAPGDDADTTNGNWSTGVGVAPGFTTYIHSQYKIVNADGSQTYNITTGVAGVIGYVELTEIVSSILDPFGQFGIFGI